MYLDFDGWLDHGISRSLWKVVVGILLENVNNVAEEDSLNSQYVSSCIYIINLKV